MKWRLVAALIATTLLVILVQDIPLSYYIQGVQRDRIITGLERDAFVLAGRPVQVLAASVSGASSTGLLVAWGTLAWAVVS